MAIFDGGANAKFTGTVTAAGLYSDTATITNAMCATNMELARTKLAQTTLAPFSISLLDWRVWDAISTFLPATPAADDLGVITGTFATDSPYISAGDLKAAGATTRYMRNILHLAPEYDDGQTITLRFHAGLLTTVADTSCVLDCSVYKMDEGSGIGSDLVTTASTSINSLTLADYDFQITPTGLVSGDSLDCRVLITCTDAATGTAVTPIIGATQLLQDIRG